MAKNLKRYYQVWELRQQGKKLLDIAHLMGYKSGESPRRMIALIDFKIASNQPKSDELKKLMLKY
jgi:hypothetical protein